MTDDNARRASWRDHLKVHPAADLFPLMSEDELRELGEDIKKNGLKLPILYCAAPGDENGKPALIDGRNRIAAMELVGIATVNEKGIVVDKDGAVYNGTGLAYPTYAGVLDPYELVLSLNIHRRNLTQEQRRELIAKIIKVKPEASDRAIAKQVKRDHKTVAKVRKKLESTGEVSPVQTRVGADGKQRKSRAKKKDIDPYTVGDACVVAALEAESADRATGSVEVSVEQRRGEMARLDGPASSKKSLDDLEVERDRKACVALDLKVKEANRELAQWRLDHPVTASAEISEEQRRAENARLDKSDENQEGLVDRALHLIAAMDDKQRLRFHDKYTELYGAAS